MTDATAAAGQSNASGLHDAPANATHEEQDGVPVFPFLNNTEAANALASDAAGQGRTGEEDNDDEPAVAKPFVRTSSPDSAARTADVNVDDSKAPDRLVYKMHKFSLYETASRYYIVGGDVTERRYRILKIDRTTDDSDLSITDDKIVYSQKEMNQLLDTIDDGNKGSGGIKLRCTTWGLLGFIKFTGPYYMLLITKKSTVAMIGGHYIYQVDGTELIPLTPARFKADSKNTEESRFLGILNNLDLTRSFYYSYSYDITRTLQHNVTRERDALARGMPVPWDGDFNSMFVWNSYLLQPAAKGLRDPYDWCRPIIHGYIDQAGEYTSVHLRALQPGLGMLMSS
jgi:phosphatidylinositol 3,5-bisphosphate 5-phosphatase